MKRAFSLIALLLCLCGSSWAGTYYVATTGATSGDGSAAKAWPNVEYALQKVGGGHTIIVKPGTYKTFVIHAFAKGSAAAPTVIKSETKWGAKIQWDGIPTGYPNAVTSDSNTSWVVVDGFEVCGAQQDGIKLNGTDCVIRNCWSHDNPGQGISSQGYDRVAIERNLCEHNGSSARSGLTHGIYIGGNNCTVRSNVCRNNLFGYGIHLWSSFGQGKVQNNLVYGNSAGIALGSTGGNIISNNTIEPGILIDHPVDDKIVNNLFIQRPGYNMSDTDGGTFTQVVWDYNAYSGTPQLKPIPGLVYGPNCFTCDASLPLFVDKTNGNYLLKTGAPVIEKGTKDYIAVSNFWELTNPMTGNPTIGAFPYYSFLSDAALSDGGKDLWALLGSPFIQ